MMRVNNDAVHSVHRHPTSHHCLRKNKQDRVVPWNSKISVDVGKMEKFFSSGISDRIQRVVCSLFEFV